jgi:hypothetical protein
VGCGLDDDDDDDDGLFGCWFCFVLFGAIHICSRFLAILPSFLFLFFLSFWTSLHSTLVSILLLGWGSLIYRDDT